MRAIFYADFFASLFFHSIFVNIVWKIQNKNLSYINIRLFWLILINCSSDHIRIFFVIFFVNSRVWIQSDGIATNYNLISGFSYYNIVNLGKYTSLWNSRVWIQSNLLSINWNELKKTIWRQNAYTLRVAVI